MLKAGILLADPLPVSPSKAIKRTGREKRSTKREATMPITPWCQPAEASTITFSSAIPGRLLSMARDSCKTFASISCLTLFPACNSLANSHASPTLSVSNSRAAKSGLPIRPAAFMRGASRKPTSLLPSISLTPLTLIKAWSPGLAEFASIDNPCLTRMRFSPCRGTMSAIVPRQQRSI
ncbi:MAG: hypothetical protein A4E52_02191 [Pelotomaculum sp. PtaB.Bin013]|nr:MAG: hypothetical protein A4E52_02191 [Pelotomaculum sp. PtaB.Bin013]